MIEILKISISGSKDAVKDAVSIPKNSGWKK